MPYAHVNGQRLYYEDTGGDGPAIVFSHGLLMDGSMFAPQVQALRGAWRCITISKFLINLLPYNSLACSTINCSSSITKDFFRFRSLVRTNYCLSC